MSADQITSSANPRIKAVIGLRDRHERDARGLSLVDGAREIGRAIAAGVEVIELYVAPNLLAGGDARATLDAARAAHCQIVEVSPKVLARLAFGDRADGLVAVIRMPPLGLDQLNRLVLPAPALIAADPRTDLFNPNAIRASLGTIFNVPVAAATSAATIDWLRERGVAIIAARVDGSVPYDQVDYRGPLAMVLGSEADGLAKAWVGPGIQAVRLPMHGIADSLNVSAAAAILLYEARRQRSLT